MSMTEVEMPPADGAAYRCMYLVPVPPPHFWDRCGVDAVHAYRYPPAPVNRAADAGSHNTLELRCEEHSQANTDDDPPKE